MYMQRQAIQTRTEEYPMSKQIGQITFTETDDGFRIDVSGKTLKDMCACGCMPFFGGHMKMDECCAPKKGDAECCEEKK
jgi:hypothetical protein